MYICAYIPEVVFSVGVAVGTWVDGITVEDGFCVDVEDSVDVGVGSVVGASVDASVLVKIGNCDEAEVLVETEICVEDGSGAKTSNVAEIGVKLEVSVETGTCIKVEPSVGVTDGIAVETGSCIKVELSIGFSVGITAKVGASVEVNILVKVESCVEVEVLVSVVTWACELALAGIGVRVLETTVCVGVGIWVALSELEVDITTEVTVCCVKTVLLFFTAWSDILAGILLGGNVLLVQFGSFPAWNIKWYLYHILYVLYKPNTMPVAI